jgi:hypothetical protein
MYQATVFIYLFPSGVRSTQNVPGRREMCVPGVLSPCSELRVHAEIFLAPQFSFNGSALALCKCKNLVKYTRGFAIQEPVLSLRWRWVAVAIVQ